MQATATPQPLSPAYAETLTRSVLATARNIELKQ